MTDRKKSYKILKLLLFSIFVITFVYIYISDSQTILSLQVIESYHQDLSVWAEKKPVLVAVGFIITYCIVVIFAIPGAVWATIAGGLIFGTLMGTIYAIVGATLGAIAFFLVAKFILYDFFRAKMGSVGLRMEVKFNEHAISYLFFLRLFPLFPFWLVNLVPAVVGVSLRVYVICTCIGIIPGTFVYASLGNGLGIILKEGAPLNLDIIFSPQILLPLIAASTLSLFPIIFEKVKRKRPG